MTNKEADDLIALPKNIVSNGAIQKRHVISQKFPLRIRMEMTSDQSDDFCFLWQIKQSKKNTLRMSFHCQENDSKIGLMRLDYGSGHKNPEKLNEFVPEKFIPFKGEWFTNDTAHVHYHVQGYKSLAWALPIENTEFEVKNLYNNELINKNISHIIMQFAKMINLKTKIQFVNVNPSLPL